MTSLVGSTLKSPIQLVKTDVPLYDLATTINIIYNVQFIDTIQLNFRAKNSKLLKEFLVWLPKTCNAALRKSESIYQEAKNLKVA